MTLREACALKELMKTNQDLWAVNNLRDFNAGPNKWRVDANIKETGEVIRMRSLGEYQDWVVGLAVKAEQEERAELLEKFDELVDKAEVEGG